MDKSYRIKANVGIDQVLNVNLKQDIDIYEVLSLKLKQENLYKLHSADYGVIVGRVLANDAFGVPNAKVTVFIPLSDVDKLKKGIRDIYPYDFVTDVDNRNVKFNALPNYKKFSCHQEVGSFPKKQLVLDEDTVLEVYDKYYKYTTITNKSGDYMIFGVPTGEQILHVDVDLSDIGIISQEPRDFIYKGYSIDLFESPTQFKKSTNLDDLPQIQTQNVSVTIYPLWGDKTTNEIAITRKDINLQYKFETTCVFIGSVITDNGPNSMGHSCIPDANVGEAGQLSPSKGNIEMIRKTVDDKIEEYPIKGNQLIDGDGTWCYQIPMNLDYVGMDEYGNIVPTNNPNKGIPTRARVRFRFTLDETGEDDLTRHKARYLVPNNPDMYEGHREPHMYDDVMDKDLYYEFGTLTPEDCFRDLYWNKVYSVKNYIPRIQMSKHEKSENYLAIKGVNKKDAMKNNPIPFNKLNLNMSIPAYYMIYRYSTGDKGVSGFWRFLRTYSILYNVDNVRERIIEDLDAIGLDFYNDWLNGCLYFPSWFWHIRQKKKYKKGESEYDSVFCECKNVADDNIPDRLYLYNNCSLVYENDNMVIKTYNKVTDSYLYDSFYDLYTGIPFGSKQFFSGIIKKVKNKDGAYAYYYTFGNKLENDKVEGNPDFNKKFPEEIRPKDGVYYYRYARLYSTDIILLGSLKDCDLDGVPKVSYSIPSTTSNIPPMGRYKPQSEEVQGEAKEQEPDYDAEDIESNLVSHNGMSWGSHWRSKGGFWQQIAKSIVGGFPTYKYYLGSGLFFGLSIHKVYHGSDWATIGLIATLGAFGALLSSIFGTGRHLDRIDIVPYSDLKTCVNAERISELGVTLDSEVNIEYDSIDDSSGYSFVSEIDGLITKREIEDIDTRALFATLNFNKLVGTSENYITGYKKYDLKYFYPTNFDGRMGDEIRLKNKDNNKFNVKSAISEYYTNNVTTDDRNKDYLDFRFGNRKEKYNQNYRTLSVGFDGKQRWVSPSFSDFVKTVKKVSNDEYNEYRIGDGFTTITRFCKPKNRHFYGYSKNTDAVYPLRKNRLYFEDYPYSFPLYDNSFYFYFGMNQGSTAIDKFYEKFYSECPDKNTSPFIMNVSTTAATACNSKSGSIRINVEEINMPYSIFLWHGDEISEEYRGLNVYTHTFTNLSNGEYRIDVKDVYGTTLSENVVLKYQKISLKTTVVRGITTEYINQDCEEICSNDYYGKLSIDSYINYGTKYNANLSKIREGIYKIGDGQYGDIRIEIKPNIGSNFSDYVCKNECGKPEFEGNVINISKPGTFTISVYEMCNEEISSNISYYTVTIPDTKGLEMYINGVPLKYIVGREEDLLPYNKWFHNNGERVTGVTDTSIKGWFGVHNPKSYDELFQTPLSTDANKLTWLIDIVNGGNLDIIHEKFNYMFNLSEGAYVTANEQSSFVVNIDGASGELLLRSAAPEYSKFSEYNTEICPNNCFKSYLTNENKEVICNEFNANIVSENYRYVNDDKFPTGNPVPNGYDFNPKYKDSLDKAANYFAGFSNNANIVQLTENECEQRTDYKPYQVIPYKAHDLYKEYGMCVYDEKDDILQKVYTPDNSLGTKRYFRTEFIDRRFDYDFVYITGRKPNHYDVENYEYESDGIWRMARISALTYNGIEMEYDSSKNIISSNSIDTEYNYNIDDCTVKLNDGIKRFYESKLYYGDGKYVDLVDGFKSTKNTNPKAYYYNNDNANDKVTCDYLVSNDNDSKVNGNFGLNVDNGNVTYPTLRSISFNNIPYGDNYTFTNVSCSYNKIDIIQNTQSILAKAAYGEEVSHSIEGGELVKIVCSDFEKYCTDGNYNVHFIGSSGTSSELYCDRINSIDFVIDAKSTTGFRSKFGEIGIKICGDDINHTFLNEIKSNALTSYQSVVNTINNAQKMSIPTDTNFMDSDIVRNKIYKISCDWSSSKFLNIVFDREYFSQAADSLMKKIKVINTSTVFNVNNFTFSYVSHQIVRDEFVIPGEDVNIDVSGDVTICGNTSNLENTEVDVQDITGGTERDYTVFEFSSSSFLVHCLDNICFNVTYKGTSVNYMLTDDNFEIIQRTSDSIKVGVKWDRHNVLLKNGGGDSAVVKVFLKIKNEIKSQNGEGHLVFGYSFKITGESLNMNFN